MRETLEIRVDKPTAGRIESELDLKLKQVGRDPVVMYDLKLPLEDPRWERIRSLCAADGAPRTGWGKRLMSSVGLGPASGFAGYGYTVASFRRSYSQVEIAASDFFELDAPSRPVLDRQPEDEAAVYDMSSACPKCRYGWRQKAELSFNKASLKSDAILRVFGRSEWLVQDSFRMATEGLHQGCEFRPIRQLKRGTVIPGWHQLVVEPRVRLAFPETRFGSDPLHVGPEHALACPDGHTRGLRLCSEPCMLEEPANPITATLDLVGGLDALNVPYPVLIVSREVRERLVERGLDKGLFFHRARLHRGT